MKVPTESCDNGGAGLGLAICKGLVELMGGENSARNNKGGGSTFEVALKLEAVKAEDKRRLEALPAQEMAKEREVRLEAPVLVVDDSDQNRFVIQRQLEFIVASTLEADDGPSALKVLEKQKVGLVFLD